MLTRSQGAKAECPRKPYRCGSSSRSGLWWPGTASNQHGESPGHRLRWRSASVAAKATSLRGVWIGGSRWNAPASCFARWQCARVNDGRSPGTVWRGWWRRRRGELERSNDQRRHHEWVRRTGPGRIVSASACKPATEWSDSAEEQPGAVGLVLRRVVLGFCPVSGPAAHVEARDDDCMGLGVRSSIGHKITGNIRGFMGFVEHGE